MKLIIDARVKERRTDLPRFAIANRITEQLPWGTRSRGEVLRVYRQIGDVTARLL